MGRLAFQTLVLAGVWLLAVLLPAPAAADGFFTAPVHLGALPGIPRQTACIVFKDGTETLIVQSTMDSGAVGDHAWILPVPSRPSAIESVDPGLLECLHWINAPDTLAPPILPPFLPFLGLLLALLFARLVHQRVGNAFATVGLLFVGVVLHMTFAGPYIISTRTTGTPQLKVPAALQLVGNYETAILEPRAPADLQEWLAANGFGVLPDAGLPVVQAYIDDGWTFVTARLVADEAGALDPHPLKVTFAAEAPVFPMRLTALAGTETLVDLFVIADTPWETDELLTWTRWQRFDGIPYYYKGSKSNRFPSDVLEYPSVQAFLPARFWMTRLRGTMAPSRMANGDIHLRPGETVPHRVLFAQRDTVARHFVESALRCAGFLLLLGAFLFGKRTKEYKPRGFLWMLLVCLVLGVFYAGVRWWGIPTPPEGEQVVGARDFRPFADNELAGPTRMETFLRREGDPWDPEELRAHIKATHTNLVTGGPIREAESPGNFTVTQDAEGRWVIRSFRYGYPHFEVPL